MVYCLFYIFKNKGPYFIEIVCLISQRFHIICNKHNLLKWCHAGMTCAVISD